MVTREGIGMTSTRTRTRMTERLPESDYATWFLETMAPEKVAMGGAYLLSDACTVHGEIFMMGGGRVSRLTLAESDGVLDAGTSIEAVRDAMPRIMADTRFSYPADLGERSVKVSAMFGFGRCCTTISRGRPQRRCRGTTGPQTTSQTGCPSRTGHGTDS